MRPSPEPMSNSLLVELVPFRKRETFSICLVVAGTYGKQYLRSAGDTNGMHIILKPTPMPPVITHYVYMHCTKSSSSDDFTR